MYRGLIDRLGDTLQIVKNNPKAGKVLTAALANINFYDLKRFIDKGFLVEVHAPSGKAKRLRLSEKGKVFLSHYSVLKLRLLVFD